MGLIEGSQMNEQDFFQVWLEAFRRRYRREQGRSTYTVSELIRRLYIWCCKSDHQATANKARLRVDNVMETLNQLLDNHNHQSPNISSDLLTALKGKLFCIALF